MTENAMIKATDVNVDEIGRIGKMLALSGYFESANNLEVAVAQMATKVLAGREMGFGPFASANGIHIIKGKPGVGANLMASAVKSHPRYDYRVREMSTTVCKLEFFERADSGEWESIGVSEFTEADAKAAGTQNMQKFARNMLFARAMSNGVRWFCPDVFNGNAVYVPEELGANVDGDGNVIDAGYTVHKPQTANGTHEGHADAEVVVDMAAIPEDTAGHLATPQQNGNGAKPKAKAATKAAPANADHAGLVKQVNALGEAAWNDWADKRVALFEANGVDSTDSLSDDTLTKLIAKASQVLRDEMAAALEGFDPAGQVELVRQASANKDGKFAVDHVNMLKDGWNVYFAHKKLAELLAA